MRRLFAVAALMLACAFAQAVPAHIDSAVPQARLAGSGTYTYFTMKIYSAELWVGPQGYNDGRAVRARPALRAQAEWQEDRRSERGANREDRRRHRRPTRGLAAEDDRRSFRT